MNTKTYYFPNDGHADAIYGSQYPVCLDEAEVKRLSREWGEDLFEVMHEATPDEIAEYGVYNSEEKTAEKLWDVRFTSDGRVSTMSRGFFEKTCRLSLRPWNDADYAEIGVYRIDVTSCDTAYKREAMRRFFRRVGLVDQFDAVMAATSEA